jgi:CHAT domain-containing protein
LTIIPDGALALLPFEALVVKGDPKWVKGEWGSYPSGLTYVGDLHPIAYSPSITAMTLARKLKKREWDGEPALVLADPVFHMSDSRARDEISETRLDKVDSGLSISLMSGKTAEGIMGIKLERLTGTADLAEYLKDLFNQGSDVYTGMQATKKTFLSTVAPKLDEYKYVVFATHGFASNSIPGIMEPVLALTLAPPGTDGLLTMSEVAGVKMKASLAALTACETAVGSRLAGEGVLSMGRAFQCAGAESVLMSLWSVAEDSSILLVKSIFRHMKEGKGKLEALELARSEIRSQGFEHPFFWAPFVLVGEPE